MSVIRKGWEGAELPVNLLHLSSSKGNGKCQPPLFLQRRGPVDSLWCLGTMLEDCLDLSGVWFCVRVKACLVRPLHSASISQKQDLWHAYPLQQRVVKTRMVQTPP